MGIPIVYRVIGGCVFLVAIFTAGYFFGWRGQHDALVKFRADVATAGRIQAEQSHAKELANEKIVEDVAVSYSAEFNRLQHNLARRGGVPKVAAHPGKPAIPDGQPGGTCEGTQFYANALDCELKLRGIREWVVKQGIPVTTDK